MVEKNYYLMIGLSGCEVPGPNFHLCSHAVSVRYTLFNNTLNRWRVSLIIVNYITQQMSSHSAWERDNFISHKVV